MQTASVGPWPAAEGRYRRTWIDKEQVGEDGHHVGDEARINVAPNEAQDCSLRKKIGMSGKALGVLHEAPTVGRLCIVQGRRTNALTRAYLIVTLKVRS